MRTVRSSLRPAGAPASRGASRRRLSLVVALTWLLPLSATTVAASPSCGDAARGADTARGTVFLDLNGDGARQSAEQGVADVALSNGCDVVRTDRDGRYEIPLAERQILFVTQPSGYRVAENEQQLPQFHYLHYPNGSVTAVAGEEIDWQWQVIGPTGPLPDAIDFPLLPDPDTAERFRAYALADTQAGTPLEQDMLREELLGALVGNPYAAAFSITVGDVVNDNLALYERHIDMMSKVGAPSWFLPGNHDINFASPDAAHANETFKRHFGPTYYSFEVGRVHFVALNNVEYAGAAGNESFANGRYRGFISEDQLFWLERNLNGVPRDRLIVVATHIPLLTSAPGSDGKPGGDNLNTVNLSQLLELLAPFEHVYAIAGHDTSNSWKQQIDHRHGWTGEPWIAHTLAEVRGNGWSRGPVDTRGVRDAMMQDGNPNGFYVLRFDGTEAVPDFVPFPSGPDAGRHLRITLDPPLAPRQDDGGALRRGRLRPGTKVVVNLFDGGARDLVEVSIDGGPFRPMRHTLRTDPTVERLRERLPKEDRFGAPAVSSHIWELPLAELEPGVHVLAVRARDEFGQERSSSAAFEIE